MSNTTALIKLLTFSQDSLIHIDPVGTNSPRCSQPTWEPHTHTLVRTPFSATRAISPCPSSAAAVPVSSLIFAAASFCSWLRPLAGPWPWFITCHVGSCWWTDLLPAPWDCAPWVRAWPVLSHPWLWLPSPGELAGPLLWTTERANNRLDHYAQEVFATNSVQKWKTALNAGDFANNLVNGIRSIIIKN